MTAARNTWSERVYAQKPNTIDYEMNGMLSHHVSESIETYDPDQLSRASTITVMSCQSPPSEHQWPQNDESYASTIGALCQP